MELIVNTVATIVATEPASARTRRVRSSTASLAITATIATIATGKQVTAFFNNVSQITHKHGHLWLTGAGKSLRAIRGQHR